MTNIIAQKIQSDQLARNNASTNSKLRTVEWLTVTNNAVTARNLDATRLQNQAEINRVNQEYVVATQNVLNDKALDFLVRNSMIDAPTLTSIVAGFELARASRADKLNEQRQFTVDNLGRRTAIAEEARGMATELNQANLESAQATADVELKTNAATFAQESAAVRADISDQETRNNNAIQQANNVANRDAEQQDRIETMQFGVDNREPTKGPKSDRLSLMNEAVANQRVIDTNRAGQSGQVNSVPPVVTQPVQPTVTQPVQPDVVEPTQAEVDGTIPTVGTLPVNPINNQNSNRLNDITRQLLVLPDTPLDQADRFSVIPDNPDELTDVQKQIAMKLGELGLQDDVITKAEKNRIQFLREEREGEVIPFVADRFSTSDPSVQRDLLNERYKVLIQDIRTRPLTDGPLTELLTDDGDTPEVGTEPILFNQGVIDYVNGVNQADDDTLVDITELQKVMSDGNRVLGELTPDDIQKFLDEEKEKDEEDLGDTP